MKNLHFKTLIVLLVLFFYSDFAVGQRYTSSELKLLVKKGQVVEDLLKQERYLVIFVGDIESIVDEIEQTNKQYKDMYEEAGLDIYSNRGLPELVLDLRYWDDITDNDLFMGLKTETSWNKDESKYQLDVEIMFLDEICYSYINVSVDVCNE